MLLSSVILILQETLEAVLLIGALLAISHHLRQKIGWLAWGLCAGVPLAYLYATHLSEVSEWFDYVGQEIVNAALMIAISMTVVIYIWTLFTGRQTDSKDGLTNQHRGSAALAIYAAVLVTIDITREGMETVLFLGGFLQQSNSIQPVMIGSFVGFSIGISVGVLLLFSLLGLPEKWRLGIPVFLLALIAGNMLSQASLLLAQADWISSTQPLWDSSGWIAENSVTGKLLYALVGYEATPSAQELISYIAGTTLVLAIAALAAKYAGHQPKSK